MNLALFRIVAVALALLGVGGAVLATPLSTAFTYQGRLEQSGEPLDGTADVIFRLFDASTGGTQIATQQVNNVTVAQGLFTASIDLGAPAFNGDARWLEIAVRSPAGGGVFTTLTPRQPLSATPYALQTRGIFVDSTNRVGIGTTTPAKKLTIAGDMEMGTHSGDYRHFRIGGGNCSGFLYGSFPALGDGIHMGYNYYADGAGIHRIIATDGQTSRLSLGYGYAALATGSTNQVPINRLTVITNGHIGVGTDSPAAKLDVRGDVKLGPSGQYFAPAGEEKLRMVRGTVDANGFILHGSGFTSLRSAQGTYHVTFNPPFASIPTVTASVVIGGAVHNGEYVRVGYASASEIHVEVSDENAFDTDGKFSFCALGPR